MSGVYNCSGHDILIPNIVKSDGIYLIDAHGTKYMDLESGVWCTSLGHRNHRINELIKKQIESIMHAGFCYSSDAVAKSAESVLSVTGFSDGGCVFLCSGSEAIELARQMSKKITGRSLSMTLHDSYLGSYSSVIDRTSNWYLFDWERCGRCPDWEKCSVDCEELQSIPEDVGEFIFEPGSSSGFVRFPPKPLIQNIVSIVRGNGGKIVVNEVTTGIGRTGEWFGYNHYGIEPDLIAIGKGIGNGYPVSVTAINRLTLDQLKKSAFKYNQSHQNDPLGAAVANEVLNTIKDEGLIPKSAANGLKLLGKLQQLVDGDVISEVRGRGLMLAVDICDEQTGNLIYEKLIRKGYLICNRKALFRIDPPLIAGEDDLDRFVDAFGEILKSL